MISNGLLKAIIRGELCKDQTLFSSNASVTDRTKYARFVLPRVFAPLFSYMGPAYLLKKPRFQPLRSFFLHRLTSKRRPLKSTCLGCIKSVCLRNSSFMTD